MKTFYDLFNLFVNGREVANLSMAKSREAPPTQQPEFFSHNS